MRGLGKNRPKRRDSLRINVCAVTSDKLQQIVIDLRKEPVMSRLILSRPGFALRSASLLLGLFLFSGCSALHQTHSDLRADHDHASSSPMSNGTESQEWAKQRLAKSPRHQEWVKIKYKPANANVERE